MKRMLILSLALLAVVAFSLPVVAANKQHQHGGGDCAGCPQKQNASGAMDCANCPNKDAAGNPNCANCPRSGNATANADAAATDAAYQKYLDESAPLRKELALDGAEFDALMAAQNPDPAKVRALKAKIWDNHLKLKEIAAKHGVDMGGGCGKGAKGAGKGCGKGEGKGCAMMQGGHDH